LLRDVYDDFVSFVALTGAGRGGFKSGNKPLTFGFEGVFGNDAFQVCGGYQYQQRDDNDYYHRLRQRKSPKTEDARLVP
jgi:hypothetical protein